LPLDGIERIDVYRGTIPWVLALASAASTWSVDPATSEVSTGYGH
jgi:hypothetical protein